MDNLRLDVLETIEAEIRNLKWEAMGDKAIKDFYRARKDGFAGARNSEFRIKMSVILKEFAVSSDPLEMVYISTWASCKARTLQQYRIAQYRISTRKVR